MLTALKEVVGRVAHENTEGDHSQLITRERQRNCLEQCISSIDRCMELSEEDLVDLEAEELRYCLKSLSRLTGEVDVEEILDIVFSEFCIGNLFVLLTEVIRRVLRTRRAEKIKELEIKFECEKGAK